MVYKRKYKVNKNELKKYFQDLTELEDWIPYKIRMELPKGYSLKLGKNATKVKTTFNQNNFSSLMAG